MTVQVIVTLHVHQFGIVQIFRVNTFPEILPVDAVNHVSHDGSVSVTIALVHVLGPLFV